MKHLVLQDPSGSHHDAPDAETDGLDSDDDNDVLKSAQVCKLGGAAKQHLLTCSHQLDSAFVCAHGWREQDCQGNSQSFTAHGPSHQTCIYSVDLAQMWLNKLACNMQSRQSP